jgi:hypothetical protein
MWCFHKQKVLYVLSPCTYEELIIYNILISFFFTIKVFQKCDFQRLLTALNVPEWIVCHQRTKCQGAEALLTAVNSASALSLPKQVV